VYDQFAAAGDWMRSTLPDLETVINSDVRTVIYDGDADYFFNFKGVEAMVRPSCSLLPHLLPLLTFDMTDACADFCLEHKVFGTVRTTEIRRF
jgi:hypothetical protein